MSEVMENIKTRRSFRQYDPKPVPRALIDRVIEAGLYAASGMGRQSPIIVAVTDKETRDRLAEANRAIAGAPEGMDPFYGAPAVLIVLADKSVPTHVYDGSTAMENMLLEAHDLGLGSCWIHRAKEEFEQPEWKEWLAFLGVRGDYEGVGHCILGYPAEGVRPKAAPRNEHRVFYAE